MYIEKIIVRRGRPPKIELIIVKTRKQFKSVIAQ